ncbi:hypothetical protein A2Z23_00725 [Candidatus Curtissbacteria bacterium RBG_16_39_7]|uniref:Uncharacterized protein n=1 Tax=Candidatus Curtissbacteria bacterium RBG_16_39_7 TaxID=1797707 RepID=A0A1F5G1U1_9BACT|nr:MAG: hypothetical protein A2Z23_00725 [Candidatus Curtissbacteria bacterium RBG_16_39_7]
MGTQLAHMNDFWATPSARGEGWFPGCHMMGPGMMGFWGGPGATGGLQSGFWIWSILGWLTWILVIVALIAFIRWMWKKGDKEK